MKKSWAVPFISTTSLAHIWWGVLMIPLWWVLGFRFFIFQLVTAVAFFKLLVRQKKGTRLSITLENSILFAFALLYLLSLLINIGSIPFSRIVGSLNNLSFWIMGTVVIFIIYNSADKVDLKRFSKAFPFLGSLYGLFVIGSFSIGLITHNILSFRSFLSMLLPEKWLELIASKAMLLNASLQLVFVGKDKVFSRPFPRSPGFNVYGTALGLTMVLIIIMTLVYFKGADKKKLLPVILSLEIGALILSLSRTAVFGFVCSVAAIFILLNLRKSSFKKFVPVLLMVLIIILIIIPPKKIYNTLYNFRKGSSVWRIRLYHLTLNQAMEKPILGHGFKPRPEDFPVPIGSHSTYIGVIYKTGFLGLLVFLAFWGLVLKKWWSGRKSVAKDDFLISVWTFTGIGLISGLIWMLTEDLDAPPIAAFLYFIVVGLALSIDKLKSSPDQIVTAAADLNQNQSVDQSIEQTAEKAPPLARDPNSSEPHS